MNGRFIEYLVGGLIAVVFGLMVLHAPIIIYFGTIFPGLALEIKSWKEILMIIIGTLLIIELIRKKRWPEVVKDKLFWLIIAFFFIHILSYLIFSIDPRAYMAGLAIDLRYLLFFSLCYVFVLLYPSWQRRFLYIAVAGAVVVLGFGVLQLFLPRDILMLIGYSKDTIAPYGTVDRNYDFIRIISTMRGPNPLGAYAASAVVIGFAYLLSRGKTTLRDFNSRLALGIIAAGFVCLWFSYSRSALVAAAIGVLSVFIIVFRNKITAKYWIASAVLAIILVSLLFVFRSSYFVSNVLLHEDPAEGGSIDSNQAHVESLADGIRRMLEQPLGAGVGSTGSASLMSNTPLIIENQYLFTAHEVGWLGLALFLVISYFVLKRLYGRKDWWSIGLFASGIALALIGVLLPVWVDDTVSIIWWGLVGVVLARKVSYGKAN